MGFPYEHLQTEDGGVVDTKANPLVDAQQRSAVARGHAAPAPSASPAGFPASLAPVVPQEGLPAHLSNPTVYERPDGSVIDDQIRDPDTGILLGGVPDFVKSKDKPKKDKAEQGKKKVCPSCKAENKADAIKCKRCGKALPGIKARDKKDTKKGRKELKASAEHQAVIYNTQGLNCAVEADGLLWKVACKTGTLALSPGPGQTDAEVPLVLSNDLFDSMLESFEEKAFPYVTVPETHANGALENTGYVRKAEQLGKAELMADSRLPERFHPIVQGDPDDTRYLMAGIDFTEPEVRAKAERGTIPDTSIGVKFNFRNKRTGKLFKAAWEHLALTPVPWVDGLPSFGLSQRGVFDADTAPPYDGVFVDPTVSVYTTRDGNVSQMQVRPSQAATSFYETASEWSALLSSMQSASGSEVAEGEPGEVLGAEERRQTEKSLRTNDRSVRREARSSKRGVRDMQRTSAGSTTDERGPLSSDGKDPGFVVSAVQLSSGVGGDDEYGSDSGLPSEIDVAQDVPSTERVDLPRRGRSGSLPGVLHASHRELGESHQMPKTVEQLLASQQAQAEADRKRIRDLESKLQLAQGTISSQGEQLHSENVEKRVGQLQEAGYAPALCLAVKTILSADKSVVTGGRSGLELSVSKPVKTEDGEVAVEDLKLSSPTDIVEFVLSAMPVGDGADAARFAGLQRGLGELSLSAHTDRNSEEAKVAQVEAHERDRHPERFSDNGKGDRL